MEYTSWGNRGKAGDTRIVHLFEKSDGDIATFPQVNTGDATVGEATWQLTSTPNTLTAVLPEGVTYTADTLERLRSIYPDNVRIYFITGADAVTDIVTWRDAGSIAQLATLVAATRPGYDLSHAEQVISASPYNFDVIYLEVPALAISSSYLRRRVAASQSLRYLTPDVVTGYIHKHKLYGVRSSHEGAQGGTSHD